MRNKRGITIVEVIAIIFVIVFIFALLLPILGTAHKPPKFFICQHYLLKRWSDNYIRYCQNNDNIFLSLSESSNQGIWITEIEPYEPRIKEIIKCIETKERRPDGQEYGGPNSSYLVSIEKEGSKKISIEGSYGINSWVYNPAPDSNIISTYTAENFWRGNNFQNASEIPVFADSMWAGGFPEPNGVAGQPPAENGEWSGTEYGMKNFCIDRHNGKINIAFMDGHADRVALKDLWKLKWHKNFDTDGPWTKPDTSWPDWMKSLK